MGLTHRDEFRAAESMLPELELERLVDRLAPLLRVPRGPQHRVVDTPVQPRCIGALQLARKLAEQREEVAEEAEIERREAGGVRRRGAGSPSQPCVAVRCHQVLACGSRWARCSRHRDADVFRDEMQRRIAALEARRAAQHSQQQRLWLYRRFNRGLEARALALPAASQPARGSQRRRPRCVALALLHLMRLVDLANGAPHVCAR